MRWLPGLVLLVACGGAQSPKPTPPAEESPRAAPVVDQGKIGVALDIVPKDAVVTIDELALGNATQIDPVVALAPGLHTLVVSHPAYKTYRVEFSITDKTEKFVIRLDPKPRKR